MKQAAQDEQPVLFVYVIDTGKFPQLVDGLKNDTLTSGCRMEMKNTVRLQPGPVPDLQ